MPGPVCADARDARQPASQPARGAWPCALSCPALPCPALPCSINIYSAALALRACIICHPQLQVRKPTNPSPTLPTPGTTATHAAYLAPQVE